MRKGMEEGRYGGKLVGEGGYGVWGWDWVRELARESHNSFHG